MLYQDILPRLEIEAQLAACDILAANAARLGKTAVDRERCCRQLHLRRKEGYLSLRYREYKAKDKYEERTNPLDAVHVRQAKDAYASEEEKRNSKKTSVTSVAHLRAIAARIKTGIECVIDMVGLVFHDVPPLADMDRRSLCLADGGPAKEAAG